MNPKPKPTALTPDRIAAFRSEIRAFYRRYSRRLPFRETRDPYAIVVAEIMLQQTQVGRVVPFYESWLKRFPDWPALAHADTREVLAAWSGLGYNRRALHLQKLARTVVDDLGGQLPSDPKELMRLPGIGPYTANAVAAFAFGKRTAAVDTNVRKVLIHKLDLPHDTPPADIQRIAEMVLPRTGIREWHSALMDYARLGLSARESRRISPRSRQSRYEGSIRWIRGEIVRRLTTKSRVSLAAIARDLDRPLADIQQAAEGLANDGLIVSTSKTARLR